MIIGAFERLLEFETSSWAVWNDNENANTIEFFRSRISQLHGRAVFLGLNRSEAWPAQFVNTRLPNFHTPGHVGDRRLRRFVQEANLANLIGSYMTDLSDEIKSKSDQVKIDYVTATPILISKIVSVDNSDERFIICLGGKVFDNLREGLGIAHWNVTEQTDSHIIQFSVKVNGEMWTVFRVWHPGNYGRLLHKSENELPVQLSYINEQMQVS